ncbi:MAG: hypothetical protein AAFX99_04500, partial [Myxococcota bacterium]
GGIVGESSNDNAVRESRPIYNSSGRMLWRVACIDPDGNNSGSEKTCNGAYVICARVDVAQE